MKAFQSFVYEEDEIATHNLKVLENRPVLIAYIIICISFLVASVTEFIGLGAVLCVVGFIILALARTSIFTPKIRIGSLSKDLIISEGSIQIGDNVFDFSKVQSVQIKMLYYKGQMDSNGFNNGLNNEIVITHNDIELKFKYLLPTYKHVLDMKKMNFPDNVFLYDRVL